MMISSGRWLLKQTRNKDTIIGRHCFYMKLDMGAVFLFTSPWLLLPCHSSPPILPLYYSYLSLIRTCRSLLPLLPRQAAMDAMATAGCVPAECTASKCEILTRLFFLGYDMVQRKKGKNKGVPVFSILCFSLRFSWDF